MRVVSCVPSLSELIFWLKPEALVGRTRFCILPDEIKSLPVVGGTKSLNISTIQSLRPDLVIAVKEENTRKDIEAIEEFAPVHVFDINSVEQALQAIASIGNLLEVEAKANHLINNVWSGLQALKALPDLKTLYFIWKNPYMVAGRNTYIHDILCHVGLRNAADSFDRYPQLDLAALKELNPELVLLSSEPFPFSEEHVNELREILPQAKVLRVDGAIFSWYGSHMLHIPQYVKSKLETQISNSY